MDCKKSTPATRFFSPFLFAFLISVSMHGQSVAQRKNIRSTYKLDKLQKLAQGFEKEYRLTQQRFKTAAKSRQWSKSIKQLDGTVVALKEIGADGTPLYYTTLMDPTSKVSRADALYKDGILDLGLSGSGMQVGIWDAGAALTSHQEFDTRVQNSDGASELDAHTTMVTGTLVSAGVQKKAKGVAFEAEALTNDWTRDKIEVVEAAANGLLLSNHSYGIKTDRVPDWYFGSYIKVSQDWDKIMYNAPYYLMVTAAGNAQRSYDNEVPNFGQSKDGFDLLLGFTTSKNGITVAGANVKINNNGELKEATVAGYSSFGPIDDGRIKPDLAGDGTSIYSTSSSNNKSYNSLLGTSMATPGVTGSLLLLQEYHEELYGSFMKAATLKGLALHTADDVQVPGPDYKMGWGVINTKTAAEVLRNKDFSTLVSEEQLTEGETYTFNVTANGEGRLSASISWTDPEGEFINRGDLNATTPALINDLDIRITKNGKTYFPWKLNAARANSNAVKGDNRVDPFERIDIEDASGTYTITIAHKGHLKYGIQDFSLLVSGAALTACQLIAPEEITVTGLNESEVGIEWGVQTETLFEVQYRSETDTHWTTQNTWENTLNITNLEVGKTYSVRLRSVCSQNLASDFSREFEFEFNALETILLENGPLSYSEELSITVFPNPAVNEIAIQAELSKDAVYSIITPSGNIVKSGSAIETVDVSHLSSGLYIMNVQDYSGVKSAKFFKD